MNWINSLIIKWNDFCEKIRPGVQKTGTVCRRLGSDLSVIGGYMYKFRSIILAAPVAAAAAILAVLNASRLPEAVQITKVTFDTMSDSALFGGLVFVTDHVSRAVAVYGPLAVTAACLMLMFCSKRTLYPWVISVFSLALPLLLWITNIS